jgi:hypothetical protein
MTFVPRIETGPAEPRKRGRRSHTEHWTKVTVGKPPEGGAERPVRPLPDLTKGCADE